MFWFLLIYLLTFVLGASLLYSLKITNISIYLLTLIFQAISSGIQDNKRKSKYLLIIGPSGSGKTTLFYKLKYKKLLNTTTSIIPSEMKIKENYYLVDIPGNRKIMNNYLLKYIAFTGYLILVIDSTNKSSFKEAAEMLYYIFNNLEKTGFSNKIKDQRNEFKFHIHILCNKSDLSSSRTANYIRDELERNIDRMRDDSRNYSENSYLYNEKEPFSFDFLTQIHFQWLNISLYDVKTDHSEILDLILRENIGQ